MDHLSHSCSQDAWCCPIFKNCNLTSKYIPGLNGKEVIFLSSSPQDSWRKEFLINALIFRRGFKCRAISFDFPASRSTLKLLRKEKKKKQQQTLINQVGQSSGSFSNVNGQAWTMTLTLWNVSTWTWECRWSWNFKLSQHSTNLLHVKLNKKPFKMSIEAEMWLDRNWKFNAS